VGGATLGDVERAQDSRRERFRVPWDGRVLLLRISADGRSWEAWNDWTGSIPFFHCVNGNRRVASSLEPAVVDAMALGPDDFYPPSVAAMLVHGHYFGDWTLFRSMKVLLPDSHGSWGPDGQFANPRSWTVAPADVRAGAGWDDLMEEMHTLHSAAIREALRSHTRWQLPLSGGLDSRLIAAVAAEVGADASTCTYGPARWDETLYARRVARALDLPWRHVELGAQFLADHTRTWADWFGSALHFHGMYQLPFLEQLDELDRPIMTGFTGDPLGGAQTATMAAPASSLSARFERKWHMWETAELEGLARFPVREALDEIEQELTRQWDAVEGLEHQRLWLLFQWNHVSTFSYYQPMMYDYWCGVGTPFVHAESARFTLSLPRAVLDGRRLQLDALRTFHPQLASIPGTFSELPLRMTTRHALTTAVGRRLPARMQRRLVPEVAPEPNDIDVAALRSSGPAGRWPIDDAAEALNEWVDVPRVLSEHASAVTGRRQDTNRIAAVQALAYRLTQGEAAPRRSPDHADAR
jgi:hypothetical protein